LIDSGFSPKKGVKEAISEILDKLESGRLKDDKLWYTVSTMKSLGLDQKV